MQRFCNTNSRGDGSLGDWHDNVNFSQFLRSELSLDGFCECKAHVASTLIDVYAVDDRVWTSKVDILKDIWSVSLHFGNLSENRLPALSDDNCLTGEYVLINLVATLDKGHALRSHHVIHALTIF